MRATLARLRSSRGWGSTLPHVHRSRKSRFDPQGHLPVKLDLFSVSRSEKPRLFMYVQAVSIEFNAWDRSSSSVRELWRQLSSKRVRAMRGRGPLCLFLSWPHPHARRTPPNAAARRQPQV